MQGPLDTGETTGILSAGCFEQDVCERAAKVMSNGVPVLVEYDTTSDDDLYLKHYAVDDRCS